MARFWIGTSGWHYEHWRGVFYPDDLAKRRWLSFYMERFPTVELNNSFYRQPKDTTWDGWRKAAPEGFRFAVKANRFLTHVKRLSDCADPLGRFLKGAERLREALGPILYQLPPGFHRTDENVGRLDEFLELLPGRHSHVFEFRHDSWFREETMSQLRRHKAALCSYDMPGMDCPLEATAPIGYMRFHGTGERYSGNYTDKMLEEWARRLDDLGRDLDELYVYFNNDAQGFAVANAEKLAELLDAPLPAPA